MVAQRVAALVAAGSPAALRGLAVRLARADFGQVRLARRLRWRVPAHRWSGTRRTPG